MNSSIVMISKQLKEKIISISIQRFGLSTSSEIGMVLLQNSKSSYKKAGIDVASDVMSFIVFNNEMHKLGVIKRSDLKRENP